MVCDAVQYKLLKPTGSTSGLRLNCIATPVGSFIGAIMEKIELSQGKFALVDDGDCKWLSQWKWSAQKSNRKWYAIRSLYKDGNKIATIRMHREILNTPKGREVDHINHNGLDNQRCNLRVCTHQQNMQNQRENRNTSSRFKGIYFEKACSNRPWRAQLRHNNTTHHLGDFTDEIDAAKAYDRKAIELFGEFACTNFSEVTI